MVHAPRKQRGHRLQPDVRVRGGDDSSLRRRWARPEMIAKHERPDAAVLTNRQRAAYLLTGHRLIVVRGPGGHQGAVHA